MKFRGSLTQVVDFICGNEVVRKQTKISIIKVPGGKYYYLMDVEFPDHTIEQLELGSQFIIFEGSFAELKKIAVNKQLGLFTDEQTPDSE